MPKKSKKISVDDFSQSQANPLAPCQFDGFRVWADRLLKTKKLSTDDWCALANGWVDIDREKRYLVSTKIQKTLRDTATSISVLAASIHPNVLTPTLKSSIATLTDILRNLENLEVTRLVELNKRRKTFVPSYVDDLE